jgi:virulence factor Mce-like protein
LVARAVNQRQTPTALVASPILVGTVVVLVAIVAVFITYNAKDGLPFVPTYEVTFTVPDAGGLAAGREVRIAGKRVGVVTEVRAGAAEDGSPVALVDAKLDQTLDPLRDDSVVLIRPLSPLAAKYVQLRPGEKGKPLSGGAVLPLKQAQPTVELTDAFDIFDPPTRKAIETFTTELGGAFAGRGTQFNEVLDETPALVRDLEKVTSTLTEPRTQFRRFVRGAGRVATELGDAHSELGTLVENGDTTLGAMADARGELADAIGEAPPAEEAGIRALRAVRPVLADAEAFLDDARPGIDVLKPASEQLHLALVEGTPVLKRAINLADGLSEALEAVRRLSRDPATLPVLKKLRAAVRSLKPGLKIIVPAQTVCNYLSRASRNFSSELSEGDASGTWVRFTPLDRIEEAVTTERPTEGLHVNPYPVAGRDGECETGAEPFVPGTQIGNAPGKQVALDPTSPPPGVSP